MIAKEPSLCNQIGVIAYLSVRTHNMPKACHYRFFRDVFWGRRRQGRAKNLYSSTHIPLEFAYSDCCFYLKPSTHHFSTEPLYASWLAKKQKRHKNKFCAFCAVGITGFEPATPRPPDVYSNRTELYPDRCLLRFSLKSDANLRLFFYPRKSFPNFFKKIT